MIQPIIGVIGAGKCNSTIYQLATEVGEGIAGRGAVLVCGGLGGVMEAADAIVVGPGVQVGLDVLGHALKIGKPVVGLQTIPDLKGVHYVGTAKEAVARVFELIHQT